MRLVKQCGLLITDHGVPGQIDGTELSHMFRAKWRDISVILNSGYELELGTLPDVVAYLQKPWTIDSLIQTVGNRLQPDIPVSRA